MALILIEDGIVLHVLSDSNVDVEVVNIDSEADNADELYGRYDTILSDASLSEIPYENGHQQDEPAEGQD